MEVIGDIPTRWDEKEEVVEARSWVRSPQQTFFTGFRQDFRLHIDYERVKVDATGEIIGQRHLCQLWTGASDCATDPALGPHAQAIQLHMTAIAGILWQREQARIAAEAGAQAADAAGPVTTP